MSLDVNQIRATDGKMRMYFAPRVYLIAEPQLDMREIDRFLKHESDCNDGIVDWHREDINPQDGELLCEFAGRMCYQSFGTNQGRRSTAAYLANIIGHGHGSVLEHANYTFVVARCTRGFTHQMVRHRAGCAYSQESTHFIEYDEGARTAMPGLVNAENVAESGKAIGAAFAAIATSLHGYAALVTVLPGKKKERCGTARSLLPNALESKLCFTANLRALRHIVALRGAIDNTVEIRQVACQVLSMMHVKAPTVFSAFKTKLDNKGFPYVTVEGVNKV